MAQWIDRASLWLLASLSAFCLFLSVSGGRLLIAIPAAFFTVLLLRFLIQKMPEKRLVRRSERLRLANALLRKWTLMNRDQALSEIKSMLPDLYSESEWPSVRLVQRLPKCEALSANQLIDLWRADYGKESISLLLTCSVSPDAASLIPALKSPCVHLISGDQMALKIAPMVHNLPQEEVKKERRRPLSIRAAQFIRPIHPFRSGLYMILFLILYLLTRSVFYLFSSLIFFVQLTICCAVKITDARARS